MKTALSPSSQSYCLGASSVQLQTKLQTNHATRNVSTIIRQHLQRKIGEQERALRHWTARANMRILELESRCAVIRTVGSNPTLSATKWLI